MIAVVTSGLIGVSVIFLCFYRCWQLNSYFSYRENPLSFASTTHTKNLFTFYVSGIAIAQASFIYLLLNYANAERYLYYVVGSSLLALFITATVHSSTSKLIHRTAVIYAIVGLIIWSILWHSYVHEENVIFGTLGFLLSAIVFIGCPALHLKYGNFGMSELLFAGTTIAWNILMIFFVLTI